MRQHYSRGIMTLLIAGALLTGSITAMAASSQFKMAGLAQHQETGREIYIGGLYFDQHVPIPDDLVGASGPKLMEYRVVARRTSMRSLLGGMLLQSEVATGQAPDNATTDFAQHILSTVKSSLYAGDSFEILLSEDDETIAYLNGHKLAQADDGTIADYLLMGWVGERGPSTVFRKSILSNDVDTALFAAFQANIYTSERELKVVSWISEQKPTAPDTMTEPTIGSATIVATLAPETPKTPDTMQDNTTAGSDTEPPSRVTQNDATAAATAATLRLPELKPEEPEPIPDPAGTAPTQEPIQVASLTPSTGLLNTATAADDVRENIHALGVQEYSQRLSDFHAQLIAKVYGKIRYPKRAVRRGLQGRLELDVTLSKEGKLLDINVAQPSGHAILDNAAIKAAENALTSGGLESIDPVAIAEFSNGQDNALVIPVPVQFMLTE
jgi:TonB family protein